MTVLLYLEIMSKVSVLKIIYYCLVRLTSQVIHLLTIVRHGIPLHGWTIVFPQRDTHDIITGITVWHSLSTADHFPVCIDVSLQCIPEVEMTNRPISKMHGLAWDKVSQDGKK